MVVATRPARVPSRDDARRAFGRARRARPRSRASQSAPQPRLAPHRSHAALRIATRSDILSHSTLPSSSSTPPFLFLVTRISCNITLLGRCARLYRDLRGAVVAAAMRGVRPRTGIVRDGWGSAEASPRPRGTRILMCSVGGLSSVGGRMAMALLLLPVSSPEAPDWPMRRLGSVPMGRGACMVHASLSCVYYALSCSLVRSVPRAIPATFDNDRARARRARPRRAHGGAHICRDDDARLAPPWLPIDSSATVNRHTVHVLSCRCRAARHRPTELGDLDFRRCMDLGACACRARA